MKLQCTCCEKIVSNDVPDDVVIRAALICPECIETGVIVYPEPDTDEPTQPSRPN